MSKIVLIGQGPTAAAAIESLAGQHEVAAVFRGTATVDDPVAAFAAEHSIPLIQDTTLASIQAVVSGIRPGCVVVSSYDRIIRSNLLQICPFVNVHYGPLPQYRGRANVNWAVINGELEAAITIHCIDDGLDSGNILLQKSVSIGAHATVAELYEELNEIQRKELGAAVGRFMDGDMGRPQTGIPTYCCTRVPDDGEIDWSAPTSEIYALIRALSKPYPGAYTFFVLEKLTILRAEPVAAPPRYVGRIPGRVCGLDFPNGTVDVLTGDGVLRIYTIEGPDGTGMPATSVIRSTKCSLGLQSRDLVKRIAQLEKAIESIEARRQ